MAQERYTYSGGYFINVGSLKWEEHQAQAKMYFIETRRDHQWINLFDSSRSIHVALPIPGGKSYWKYDNANSWTDLYIVTRDFVGEKVYRTSQQIDAIVKQKLAGKLTSNFRLLVADKQYFCPSLNDAKAVIKRTLVEQYQYTLEGFDCDDFALLLKAEFVRDAYVTGIRRSAHCFGIAWGKLPGDHALNWFIDNVGQLYFVEPQTDAVFLPRPADKDIYYMYV
jgi:hypothetical protein